MIFKISLLTSYKFSNDRRLSKVHFFSRNSVCFLLMAKIEKKERNVSKDSIIALLLGLAKSLYYQIQPIVS